ncbi:MAG TPA: hypothetical protein VHO25_08160, partial [Polyangiaceae bacterium]|nr:hypothetical protein [Polyangiaceae bacterium]
MSRTPAQSRKALAAAFGTIGKAYLLAQTILMEVDVEQVMEREPAPLPVKVERPRRGKSTLLDP